MTLRIVLIFVFISTVTFGQDLDSEWNAKVEALNKDYFAKLAELGAEHSALLETRRKQATTDDKLDEAIRLRDAIERIKLQTEKPVLPEDKSKLARDRLKLLNILKISKWNCSQHEHFPPWAGKR